jgi:hypothetical protein
MHVKWTTTTLRVQLCLVISETGSFFGSKRDPTSVRLSPTKSSIVVLPSLFDRDDLRLIGDGTGDSSAPKTGSWRPDGVALDWRDRPRVLQRGVGSHVGGRIRTP